MTATTTELTKDIEERAASARTPQELEALSDELLKSAGAFSSSLSVKADCYSELNPPQRHKIQHYRTQSADIAVGSGDSILLDLFRAPEPDLARLIDRALTACGDKRDAVIWALHSAGWDQQQIADKLQLSQALISRRLKITRNLILKHIDRHAAAMFGREMRRSIYKAVKPRPPLPSEVQEARAIIEELGYETCMSEYWPQSVIVLRKDGTRTKIGFFRLLSIVKQPDTIHQTLNGIPEDEE